MNASVPWAILVLLASGCVSNEAAAPLAAPDEIYTGDVGSIHGIFIDQALVPVSGAAVTLRSTNATTRSNNDGVFVFANVPVGPQVLIVNTLGFQPVSAKVEVAAGEISHVDITLVRIATSEAYYNVKIGRGLFGCGATYRQGVTTINGAFFGLGACSAANTSALGFKLDELAWHTYLSDNISIWRGAGFETAWTTNQVLGSGMVQDWAVFGCDNNRNATFTRDAGPSPLRAVLTSFQLDYRMNDMTENAKCGSTAAKDRCNFTGCHIQNRMFSWPSTQDPKALVDVGVTLQQTFTTYFSEFYRAEPQAGYTALPDH